MLKKHISTSKNGAQHPFYGQNIQLWQNVEQAIVRGDIQLISFPSPQIFYKVPHSVKKKELTTPKIVQNRF